MNLLTKKLTFVLLLTSSFAVLALQPPPLLENQTGEQPPVLPGLTAGQPAQTIQSAPVSAQSTVSALPANPAPEPEKRPISKFSQELQDLQEENAVLQAKEEQAKLRDSIAKYKNTPSDATAAATGINDSEIAIRSIYGVGRSFQAVIYYRGAEITVRQGSDINGIWTVSSINASTVRIRSGKTEKILTLSALPPLVQPSASTPAMPALLPGNNPVSPSQFKFSQ